MLSELKNMSLNIEIEHKTLKNKMKFEDNMQDMNP